MSTLSMRIPTSTAPHLRRDPPPVFGAATLRAYARYLSEREGVDQYEFTTRANLPDVAVARTFAEELRRQLGPFLNDVISVEQRNSRVTVVLRDGWNTQP